jgi:hypothetical protein
MILVFSTSVESPREIEKLRPLLNSIAGRGQWNFALDDPEKILRIISNGVNPVQAIQLLEENGFKCKELED